MDAHAPPRPQAQPCETGPQPPQAQLAFAVRACWLASPAARSAPPAGSASQGAALGSRVSGAFACRGRTPIVTQPPAPRRSSAAPETRGLSGTPKPKDTARGSLRGGGGAGGAPAGAWMNVVAPR